MRQLVIPPHQKHKEHESRRKFPIHHIQHRRHNGKSINDMVLSKNALIRPSILQLIPCHAKKKSTAKHERLEKIIRTLRVRSKTKFTKNDSSYIAP